MRHSVTDRYAWLPRLLSDKEEVPGSSPGSPTLALASGTRSVVTLNRVLRATLAGILGIVFAVAFSASATAQGRESVYRMKPALLVFHGGAFVFGDSGSMEAATTIAQRRGFIVENLDYPLQDVPAAVHFAVRRAQRLRQNGYRVFAYGESAGGTLAALLAERGLADAVAAYAPPSDLLHWPSVYSDQDFEGWFGLDPAGRIRLSPAFHRSKRPILVIQGNDGFRKTNRLWAERDPLVRYRPVAGGHPYPYGGPSAYRANTVLGLAWLRNEATTKRSRRVGR